MTDNFFIDTQSKNNNTKDPLILPDISKRPRYQYYLVRGLDKVNGKQKVVSVVALDNDSDEAIIRKSSLFPPCELKVDEKRTKPTNRQLEYAKKLNIIAPLEATFEDLSALISIQNDEDSSDLASFKLLSYAAFHNICISPYAGTQYAVMKLLRNLDGNILNTFFCYIIYCYYFSKPIENLYDLKSRSVFEKFNDYPFHDDHYEIINSFNLKEIKALLQKRSIDRRDRKKAKYLDYIKEYLFNAKELEL